MGRCNITRLAEQNCKRPSAEGTPWQRNKDTRSDPYLVVALTGSPQDDPSHKY